MTATTWDRLADWYDAKQGDDGDLWHRTLIDPTFLRVVGEVRGQRLLDLGCGNGYLSRRFARAGADVVGVDASAPVIARAKAREAKNPLGIRYLASDATQRIPLESETFDIVASNMVLMDMEDAEGAIREAARVLRSGGRFVASLSHPCFDQGPSSTWIMERSFRTTRVWRKIGRYRHPFADEMPWGIEDRTVTTIGYHRPLSWYARVLREAGFLIRSLEEPEPTKEFIEGSPQGPFVVEIPLHLVIEAVKGPATTDMGGLPRLKARSPETKRTPRSCSP